MIPNASDGLRLPAGAAGALRIASLGAAMAEAGMMEGYGLLAAGVLRSADLMSRPRPCRVTWRVASSRIEARVRVARLRRKR